MGNLIDKKKPIEPRYTVSSSSLYQSCPWDPKVIRKYILDRRLAPFYPGTEDRPEDELGRELEECPICFLFYTGGLNRSLCCRKGICTECFLQIQPPTGTAVCPFCNREHLIVKFSGPLPKEEREKEEQEEQKVREIQLKSLQLEMERDRELEEKRKAAALLKPIKKDPIVVAPIKPSPSLKPPPAQGQQNLDDLMLLEAIRISLKDSPASPAVEAMPVHSDPDDSYSRSESFEEEEEDASFQQQMAYAISLSLIDENVNN